jgi:hypothetical protein
MNKSNRFSAEVRERAVRMMQEHREASTAHGVRQRIHRQGWVSEPDAARMRQAKKSIAVSMRASPGRNVNARGGEQLRSLPNATDAPASVLRQTETPCEVRQFVASATDRPRSPAALGNSHSNLRCRLASSAVKPTAHAYGRSSLCAQSRFGERSTA